LGHVESTFDCDISQVMALKMNDENDRPKENKKQQIT
jgi:hypothetical protein